MSKGTIAACSPILKWAGGKRWFTEAAGGLLRGRAASGYIEPFLGGASMALYLGTDAPNRLLGDVVPGLVEFYLELQRAPAQLHYVLSEIVDVYGTDANGYYEVRAAEPELPIERAARFLYLNKLGFNGLHRVNADGKFNVPVGSKAKNDPEAARASLPDLAQIYATSRALAGAQIVCLDFEQLVDQAGPSDFLYVDPPYFDTFTDYSKGGFGVPEQERLAMALHRASERGATFLAHNSLEGGHETGVAYWYEEIGHVIPIHERRRIAANGGRAAAPCALITNNDNLAEHLGILATPYAASSGWICPACGEHSLSQAHACLEDVA